MLTRMQRLHRAVVDRLSENRWLRGRSGANAAWTHYEHHARVWRKTAERHAAAKASAHGRAEAMHAKGRDTAMRIARHGPPRVLPRWQEAIARLIGTSTVHSPQERSGK